MKAYSLDLRSKVLKVWKNKEFSIREIASRFDINKSTVQRYIKLFKETGALDRRPRKNLHLIKIGLKEQQFLKKMVNKKPEVSLKELQQKLKLRLRVSVTQAAICIHLKKLNLSRKKKPLTQRNKIQ